MNFKSLCLAAVVGMIAIGCGDSKEAKEAPAQEATQQEATPSTEATQETQNPESNTDSQNEAAQSLEPAAQGSVSGTDMATNAALSANPWTLVSLNNNGTEIAIPSDVQAVLEFKGKEFSGKAGCNSIFGSYEAGADSISFSEGAGMTRMMCSPEVMAVEDTLVKVLSGSATLSIFGGALTLEKDGIAARFSY